MPERFQRQTKQRRIILTELRKLKSHPTAEELLEVVRGKLPNTSLSTVYRNLESMAQLGLINKLDSGGGQNRYDGDISPHCHIRCLECGLLEDVPAPAGAMNEYLQRLDRPDLIGWRLELLTICPACRGNNQ